MVHAKLPTAALLRTLTCFSALIAAIASGYLVVGLLPPCGPERKRELEVFLAPVGPVFLGVSFFAIGIGKVFRVQTESLRLKFRFALVVLATLVVMVWNPRSDSTAKAPTGIPGVTDYPQNPKHGG